MADAIDDFIALPRTQQLGTLQQLAPAKQDKLLAAVKQRRSKTPATSSGPTMGAYTGPHGYKQTVDALTRIEPITKGETPAQKVGTFVGDIGAGGLGVLLHPIDTLTGMVKSVTPGTSTPNPIRGIYEGLNTQPAETIASGIGQAAVLDPAGEAVKPIVQGFRDTAGRAVRAAAGAGPKTVRDLVKETKALNQKGAADTATANDMEASKAETTRKTELAKHATDKAKAAAKNQDVQEGLASDLEAQRKIAPTTKKLTNARAALRAAVETAREKALKVGNEKYNTVNKVLNPIPAQPEFYQYVVSKAGDELAGSKGAPTYLKAINQRIKSEAPIRYEDLQSDYSNLGRELSKGTLPGDVYHAYDVMHEAIGDEMQRIADSEQMGGHLTDARNYWRRMKQTFGKPITFTDAANKAIGGVKDEAQENAIRLLGSFDPAIPQIAAHVANIEKGVESLPKPVPERVLTRDAAGKRVAAPQLELTPRPTPKTFEPQKIGPEEVAGAKGKGVEARERQIGHRTGWVAAGSLIYATLDMLKGEVPSPVGVGASVGGSLAIQAAVTKMLTSPKVLDFLTKATPADVAQIPPELRGDFPKLLSAAQKRGIKVSPALTAGFTTAAIAGKKNDSNK